MVNVTKQMGSSRDRIFERLQREAEPFPEVPEHASYLPMIPVEETATESLLALFAQKAVDAGCEIQQVKTADAAAAAIIQLVGEDKTISCWELDRIRLAGLGDALAEAHISCVGQDAAVRVGLTGADAALAATGSLVLSSGSGQFRAASLLPPVHVAVVTSGQILPNLESWWAQQRERGLEHTLQASNIVIITGPSRTADIALQPVMGMHGPGQLHVVLVDET